MLPSKYVHHIFSVAITFVIVLIILYEVYETLFKTYDG